MGILTPGEAIRAATIAFGTVRPSVAHSVATFAAASRFAESDWI